VLVDCVQQYYYLRERKYCPFDDLNDLSYVVKENAPELLRKALGRLPVDVIATCDYRAATIHCTANHFGRFVLAGRPCDRRVSLLAGRSIVKQWCGLIRKIYITLTLQLTGTGV